MENSSEKSPQETEQVPFENEPVHIEDSVAESPIEPAPPAKQSSTGPNPLSIGFALVVAFAIGLALGFFGRPKIIKDVPVQVVVTVVPDTSAQGVASNNNSNATNNAEAIDENNNSAAEPKSETNAEAVASNNNNSNINDTEDTVDPNAPPTPTIMDFLMSDARHIQGDEAAPVTIIEFSDFK